MQSSLQTNYRFTAGNVHRIFSVLKIQKVYGCIYTLQTIVFTSLLLMAFFIASAPNLFAQPVVKWDKSFGNARYSDVSKVLKTWDGNFLIVGNASAEASEDKSQVGQNTDTWVLKSDPQGKIIWEKTIIASGDGEGTDAIQTSDGGYAILSSSNESGIGFDKSEASRGITDYWIIKLNKEGLIQWEKTIGGNNYDHPSSILQTKDGGYLVGGTSNSTVGAEKTGTWKGGEGDYWVVKLSSTGKKEWDKTFGGTENDHLNCMLATAEGGYLLGGSSQSPVGGDKSEYKGTSDYWVVRIDPLGNKLWDKAYGGNSSDDLQLMYPHPEGGFILMGTSHSSINQDRTDYNRGKGDVWFVKINDNGEKVWDKAYGGSDRDTFYNLEPTPDGGFLISAASSSPATGDKSEDRKPSKQFSTWDYWLIKVSSTFEKIWDKTIGGSQNDQLVYATELSDGNYFLAGSSDSGNPAEPDYDRTAAPKGRNDIWLVGAQEPSLPATPIRINAGGPAFTTATKKLFSADRYYAGIDRTSSIAIGDILNTTNDVLYRSGRCSPSFSYNIPVANGTVDVILHFAEIWYGVPGKGTGGAGKRQFNVTIENSRKLTNFDIFAAAGGAMRAVQKSIPVTVTDGVLNIDFTSGAADLPRISAIEVIRTSSTLKPLADAYVRDGSYNATNFGIATILDVKSNASDASARRSSYLRFQLPAAAAVTAAKLRIYGHNHENSTSVSVHAYGVDNDTWIETGIVKNNAPAASTPSLGYVAVNNAYKYYEIDVTSYVKAQQQSGETLVSLLLADPNNRNVRLVFNSKEEGSYPPQLIVQNSPVVNSNTRLSNEDINMSLKAEPESSSVYPNPVGKQFTVQLSSKHSENISFDLSNSSGQSNQLVTAQKAIAGQKAEVDISGLSLSSGIYMLKIKSEAATEVIKLLVTQ